MKTMLGLAGGGGAAASRVTVPTSKRTIREIDFMGLGIDDRRGQQIGNRSNIEQPTSNVEQPASERRFHVSRITFHVSRITFRKPHFHKPRPATLTLLAAGHSRMRRRV